MPGKTNKLQQFWDELKRRNVVRRNTVYAASAFVILQLVALIVEPLRLPDWTMTMLIILLVIGFILSVIFSWLFEINPDGGFERTRSAKQEKAEIPSHNRLGWKLASIVSFIVIIGLVIINIIPRNGSRKDEVLQDKSIAVLPFINDSQDKSNEYFINGTMEAILNNLSKIGDLRVVSRTSVEQYRDRPKSIPVIAREMNVSYVLEGSGQKDGEKIRLFVQLLDASNDEHIWSNHYNREITDVFSLQSEIAQLVAKEIEAIITPEEEERIDKIPTKSQSAWDFYQRGQEELNKFWEDKSNTEALEKAEDLYRYALEEDPTFALPYIQIANLYEQTYWQHWPRNPSHMDSILVNAEKALSVDDQLADAYHVLGAYYREKGMTNRAVEAYHSALKFNPNSYNTYISLGNIYKDTDVLLALENFHKSLTIEKGSESSWVLDQLAYFYTFNGFPEQSRTYLDKLLSIEQDTIDYYSEIARGWAIRGNNEKAIEYSLKAYDMAPDDQNVQIYLGIFYLFNGQFEKSMHFFDIYYATIEEAIEDIRFPNWFGYTNFEHGNKVLGDSVLSGWYKYEMEQIEANPSIEGSYFDHIIMFAYSGDSERALTNFELFIDNEDITEFDFLMLRADPLLKSIRKLPVFLELYKEAEEKYQVRQEKIKNWLMENGLYGA